MIRFLFLVLPVLFAIPQLSMKWVGDSKTDVTFRLMHHDPLVMECQKSGSDVYYRYEYQMCRRRSGWFDRCGPTAIETRTLRWDPISENYTVISDRLGDPEPASSSNYTSLEEAFEDLSSVRSVTLSSLSDEQLPRKNDWLNRYIRLRAKFTCKGQTNKTLDRISSIVTLGLVSVGTSDSGWIDFNLSDTRK